jgi:glycogen synthase
MKILMFGWEFPPHISGGLGTACYGLTQSLAKENTDILFVVPKADEHRPFNGLDVISASHVPVVLNDGEALVSTATIPLTISQKTDPKIISVIVPSELAPYFSLEDSMSDTNIEQWNYQLKEENIALDFTKREVKKGVYPFTGGYGPRLLQEVNRYAEVASEIARESEFDVIHAHDWLTYPAGMAARRISGKPLVVHVHATEFDRAGENVDERIYGIESDGMKQADRIIAVSQLTKNTIVTRYGIAADKVTVVHNGVTVRKSKTDSFKPLAGSKVVTFLGRITHQKGPEYFVEAAQSVLKKFPNVHFVMAGSGDLLPKMIKKVATLKISANFHFTGFLNNTKVDQIWEVSNVFVMPSVSEPFGITPLEAMMAGVPVIISNQSGVAEVVQHAIKVDFWDTEALANAICNLLAHKSLSNTLKTKSKTEIKELTWDRAAKKINTIYHELATKD